MGKSGSHGLSQNFKKFIDAFGMEWREVRTITLMRITLTWGWRPFPCLIQAHGEAEAELAYLNSIGKLSLSLTPRSPREADPSI